MIDTIKVLFILTGASTYLVTNSNDSNKDSHNNNNGNVGTTMMMRMESSSSPLNLSTTETVSLTINETIANRTENQNRTKLNDIAVVHPYHHLSTTTTTRTTETRPINLAINNNNANRISSINNDSSISSRTSSTNVINNFTSGFSNDSKMIITKMSLPLSSSTTATTKTVLFNLTTDNSFDTVTTLTAIINSKEIEEGMNDGENKRVAKDISHSNQQSQHQQSKSEQLHQHYHHQHQHRDRRKFLNNQINNNNDDPHNNNENKILSSSSSVISLPSLSSSLLMNNNDTFKNLMQSDSESINDNIDQQQQLPQPQQQPVYEVIINEEEKDLPKKLFQVKALMINDSSKNNKTKTKMVDIDNHPGLMFILSGNGVDYEHPEQSKFAINAFTGELFLISPLDRDPPNGREIYRLIISAEDERSEKINGSVMVLIRVRDINDNAPYFPQTEYYAQVGENLGAGIDVIRVLAVDPDPDSIVRYSIEVNRVNSDGELIFDIDELGGLISTAVCCLDRESIGQYTIKICATDRAISGDHQTYHWSNNIDAVDSVNQQKPNYLPFNNNNNVMSTLTLNQSSCTNVVINVTDENDEPPHFNRDRFYLTLNNGVNELYPQKILLNTSVVDLDLPETNRFVCRLDVHLRFPVQFNTGTTKTPLLNGNNQTTLSSSSLESLFWLFLKNETINSNSNIKNDNQTRSSIILGSGGGHNHNHYSNLNKYFQCNTNIFGNVRVQTSDTFPPKYFHQILLQEFEHYRSNLWQRFKQTFNGNFPKNNLQQHSSSTSSLFIKDLLTMPNHAELSIKIIFSDLGYFDISQQQRSFVGSTTVQAATNKININSMEKQRQLKQQQQQHIYDIVGLLESHVITSELQIRLSTEPFIGKVNPNSNDLNNPNNNDNIDENIIINKQRVLPFDGSQNDVVIDESLKRSRESSLSSTKHDHSMIGLGDSPDYIDENKNLKNNLRFGSKKFFHSTTLGKFFQSMQLNSIWLLLILFGCCLLVIVSLVFLYLTRTKRKRRDQQLNSVNNNNSNNYENHPNINLGSMLNSNCELNEDNRRHQMHSTSLMPMLMATDCLEVEDFDNDVEGVAIEKKNQTKSLSTNKSSVTITNYSNCNQKNNENIYEQKPTFSPIINHHQHQHLYYSSLNEQQISTPTTSSAATTNTLTSNIDNIDQYQSRQQSYNNYYNNQTLSNHLVLLNNDQVTPTRTTAAAASTLLSKHNGINSSNNNNSYALYDLAQISTSAIPIAPSSSSSSSTTAAININLNHYLNQQHNSTDISSSPSTTASVMTFNQFQLQRTDGINEKNDDDLINLKEEIELQSILINSNTNPHQQQGQYYEP